MLFFPNAKINIGLHIVGKRDDGFHNIETIFCPIGLSDVLEFVQLPDMPDGHLTFSSTGIPVDGKWEYNLCVKAYHLLHANLKLPALAVHLHKVIPMGAGLGGGSSDAAFMLKNLNTHFKLGLTEDQLCDYASALGSDCAFFIKNRPLLGYERGNRFREVELFPGHLQVAVIHPCIHVNTAEAYANVTPGIPVNSLEELIRLPVEDWRDKISNDFEPGIIQKYPAIGHIKGKLYEAGAIYASMSGSGSSVYGLFEENIPDLKKLFPEYSCWSGHMIME